MKRTRQRQWSCITRCKCPGWCVPLDGRTRQSGQRFTRTDMIRRQLPGECISCKRRFDLDAFWNPWGPAAGPGLACSRECCELAVPGSTAGADY